MNVLKRGKAHMALVTYFDCGFCGSNLRAIQGDPRVKLEWKNGVKGKYEIYTICPICKQRIYTAAYTYVNREVLTVKDKEEMETWKDDKLEDFTDDDLEYIGKFDMIKERHPEEEDEYI